MAEVYYDTTATIIALILLGKVLELRAKTQTSAAIKALMGLQAKTARVVRGGQEVDVPIEQVVPGVRLERIPEGTHWVIHEQPQRINALIRSFVA